MLDTGERILARGARDFARDMRKPLRIPAMVDKSAFEVGENLAVTPGAVVLHTEVFELLQYGRRRRRCVRGRCWSRRR